MQTFATREIERRLLGHSCNYILTTRFVKTSQLLSPSSFFTAWFT